MNRRNFFASLAALAAVPAVAGNRTVEQRIAAGEIIRNETLYPIETIVLRKGVHIENCIIKSTANPAVYLPNGVREGYFRNNIVQLAIS